MSTLFISIEKNQIGIARLFGSADEKAVQNNFVFDMPDQIKDDLMEHPEFLSDFIENSLQNTQFHEREVVLLFDSHIGFFKEYNHKKTDGAMSDKLFYIKNDELRKSVQCCNIAQRLDYTSSESSDSKGSGSKKRDGKNSDMVKTAIYGIDDEFFRGLIKALKKNKIKTIYATHSLVLYARTFEDSTTAARDKLYRFKRLIGFDIRGKLLRTVVIHEEDLIHMEETRMPELIKPEEQNMTDLITGVLKDYATDNPEETLVIVSGSDDVKVQAKRLSRYSGITCIPVNEFIDVPPDIYPVSGFNLRKYKDENYLYGGWSKRKFSRAAVKICVGASVMLILLFAMLPAYDFYVNSQNTELSNVISRSGYSERLDLIYENRDILSKLQVYKNDRDAILGDSIDYSEILEDLNRYLLKDGTINDLFFDAESGLIIDFDLSEEDVKAYENARDKINDKREYHIIESSVKDNNYQIKVTVLK